MGAHPIPAIQQGVMAKRFSGRAGKAIRFAVVGKSTGLKGGRTSLCVTLAWTPAVLPRAIKIHTVNCCRLNRRVVGIVTVGD